jgi:uncharacterized protein
MILEDFFKENPSVALGLSGGTDSSYLLYAGLKCGADVRPYYVKTVFQPQFELEDAKQSAAQLGTELTVMELNILDKDVLMSNSADRCYHCKTALFGELKKQASADGVPLVIDGTNASDDAADRPGMRALSELSVRSPLRECGITKERVRSLSKDAGLSTWDKPSYSCLATRIPSGRPITEGLLLRIEKAEDALSALGFVDFRVRVLGDAAKIQVSPAQMSKAISLQKEVVGSIKPYFTAVLLDLEGR